jgi:hypothetical protein
MGVIVTLRLGWTTAGKGDTDSAQLDYRVWSWGNAPPASLPFAIILPTEPWSYDGKLIKLGWTLEAIASHGTQVVRGAASLIIQSPFLHERGAYR